MREITRRHISRGESLYLVYVSVERRQVMCDNCENKSVREYSSKLLKV